MGNGSLETWFILVPGDLIAGPLLFAEFSGSVDFRSSWFVADWSQLVLDISLSGATSGILISILMKYFSRSVVIAAMDLLVRCKTDARQFDAKEKEMFSRTLPYTAIVMSLLSKYRG